MGLLDSFFAQQGYGGQGGGLLDMLRNIQTQQQYQPNAGGLGAPAPADNFAQRFEPTYDQPSGYMQIGNYKMPQFGPRELYQPQAQQQAQLPPNAQLTQGQLQSPAQPAAQPQDLPPAFQPQRRLSDLLMGKDFNAAADQSANLTAAYNATRQVLLQSGMSPQEANSKAMLAVLNPEAGKTILPEALTNKEKFTQTGEDAFGNKQFGFVNDRAQTINGKPIGQQGAMADSGGGVLAPGTQQMNSSLQGNDYLAQFAPEIQAQVRDYLAGKTTPTGNPRRTNVIKMIAAKYGSDIGVPADDTNFAERRKYRTELGTNSPNSAGGQAKAFNQGIDHLSHLATTLEKLDNSNGFGVPMIANGINSVRQGVSNEQSAISDEAKSLGQTVAGEVGKLFSGSAGGGVHERELTRERFSTVKSRPQLAAALQATIETMQGGLHALEQRRDAVLGPNNGVELVDKATIQKIAQIQAVIDRLKGDQSAPANGALAPGQSRSVNGVTIKRIN